MVGNPVKLVNFNKKKNPQTFKFYLNANVKNNFNLKAGLNSFPYFWVNNHL